MGCIPHRPVFMSGIRLPGIRQASNRGAAKSSNACGPRSRIICLRDSRKGCPRACPPRRFRSPDSPPATWATPDNPFPSSAWHGGSAISPSPTWDSTRTPSRWSDSRPPTRAPSAGSPTWARVACASPTPRASLTDSSASWHPGSRWRSASPYSRMPENPGWLRQAKLRASCRRSCSRLPAHRQADEAGHDGK